jgi:hypothetical protein
MITRGGLIELDSGWSLAVTGAPGGLVLMVLQFDPKHEVPAHGVKQLRMTAVEAEELERSIAVARSRAQEHDA